MTTRKHAISEALDAMQANGWIDDWYLYAPGDGKRRWVVWGEAVWIHEFGWPDGQSRVSSQRTYSTKEAESFIASVHTNYADRETTK